MKSFIIIIILSILSFSVQSKTYLYIWGGGGEVADTNNQFEKSFISFAKFARKIDQSKILFSNFHHSAYIKIEEKFKSKIENFDRDNINIQLNDLVEKIQSNIITSNDQIIFILNTHGSRKTNSRPHVLSCTVRSGECFEPVKEIGIIQEVLRENKLNTKLGIIDLSCYSGATQALKDKNTCVISSAGDHVSYTGSFNFSRSLRKGKNLEEIFLKEKKNVNESHIPTISTSINQHIKEDLLGLFKYYVQYDKKSFLESFRQINVEGFPRPDVESLRSSISTLLEYKDYRLIDVHLNEIIWKKRLNNLEVNLTEYQIYLRKLDKVFKFIDKPIFQNQYINTGMMVFGDPQISLYDLATDETLKDLKKSINARVFTSKEKKAKFRQKMLKEIDKIVNAKKKQLKNNKEFVLLCNFIDMFYLEFKKLRKIGIDIIQVEKEIYDLLYKSFDKTKTSNICRKIVL